MTYAGLAAICLIAPHSPGSATVTLASPSDSTAPMASRCAGVRLELKTSTNPEGRITFLGTLINDGTKTVTLVDPGDGSNVGWRTPIITWNVATSDGTLVPPPPQGARCGNVNRIDDSEIFDLAPGERHVLSEWLGGPHAPAGSYVIRLVYENDPSRKQSGVALGPTSSDALDRIANSTPCKVESAPLTAELPGRGLGPLAPE